jgi:hypothetical protein
MPVPLHIPGCLALALSLCLASTTSAGPAAPAVDYNRDVRPILSEN